MACGGDGLGVCEPGVVGWMGLVHAEIRALLIGQEGGREVNIRWRMSSVGELMVLLLRRKR